MRHIDELTWFIPLICSLLAGCSGFGNYQTTNRAIPTEKPAQRQPNAESARFSRTEFRNQDVASGLLVSEARIRDALIGVWRSREFSSNMPEFFGVTNLTFKIRGVGGVSTNVQTGAVSAHLEAELAMIDRDGKHLSAPDSAPVQLEEDRITFGIPPNGYALRFTFQAGLLVLERQSAGECFKAKLQRITRSTTEG